MTAIAAPAPIAPTISPAANVSQQQSNRNVGTIILDGSRRALKVCNFVASDSEAAWKFGDWLLSLFNVIKVTTGNCVSGGLCSSLEGFGTFVDFLGPVRDGAALAANGKTWSREGNYAKKTATALFLAGGIPAAVNTGHEWGLYDFNKASESIGTSRVFNTTNLGYAVRGLFTAAFAFLAVSSVKEAVQSARLADKGQRAREVTRCTLTTAWAVSKVALGVLIVAGVASTAGLAAATITATTLGLVQAVFPVAVPMPRAAVAVPRVSSAS